MHDWINNLLPLFTLFNCMYFSLHTKTHIHYLEVIRHTLVAVLRFFPSNSHRAKAYNLIILEKLAPEQSFILRLDNSITHGR